MLTAVLFQEQVLSNFVEKDCDILYVLKDKFASKGACFKALLPVPPLIYPFLSPQLGHMKSI